MSILGEPMPMPTGITSYRVDIAFDVIASSPAMAVRKLFNALDRGIGDAYIEAQAKLFNRHFGDAHIACDAPIFILGAYVGATYIGPPDYSGVAQ